MVVSILQTLFRGNAARNFILPQHIYPVAHVQEGFNAGCVQFIQFFNKPDHFLKVISNGFFFNCIKL